MNSILSNKIWNIHRIHKNLQELIKTYLYDDKYYINKLRDMRCEINKKIEQYEIRRRNKKFKPILLEKITQVNNGNTEMIELCKSFQEIKYHNLFSLIKNNHHDIWENYYDHLSSRYMQSDFTIGKRKFSLYLQTYSDNYMPTPGQCAIYTKCTNQDELFHEGRWSNLMAKEVIKLSFNNSITCHDLMIMMDTILQVYYENYSMIQQFDDEFYITED